MNFSRSRSRNLESTVPNSRREIAVRPPPGFDSHPRAFQKRSNLREEELREREIELNRREESIRRREREVDERTEMVKEMNRPTKDCKRTTSPTSEWITLDHLGFSSDWWDSSSSQSDDGASEDSLFKDMHNANSATEDQFRTLGSYPRRERSSNPVSYSREIGSGVPELIEAMHAMASSFNRRCSAPLAKEDMFDGDPRKYRRFIKQFEVCTLRGIQDSADKLQLLVSSCVGEARKYIEDCVMCGNAELGYLEARKILEQTYGQAHVVINAHVKGLTEGPLIRANDFKALAQLARDMRNCLITCKGIDGSGLDTQHTVGSIFQRLPKGLQDKFMGSASSKLERNELVTFADLTEFVEKRVRVGKSFLGQLSAESDEKAEKRMVKFQNNKGKAKVHSANLSKENEQKAFIKRGIKVQPRCQQCGESHQLWKCGQFGMKTVKERMDFVKTQRLCFNCLGSHQVRQCNSRLRCRECGKNHHTMLHFVGSQKGPGPNGAGEKQMMEDNVATEMTTSGNSGPTNVSSCDRGLMEKRTFCVSNSALSHRKVWLKVVPVHVWGPDRSRCITTYGFLDEGSDTTLCSQDLVDTLNLKGKKVTFSLSTLHGTNEQKGCSVDIVVKGVNESKELFLREVIAVSDLPDLDDNIPTRNDVKHYPELLNNVNFCCLTDKRVRLLIGANVQAAHRVVEARYGTVDQTSAVRSVLGWSLVGPTEDDLVRSKAFSVNYVKSDNIALNEAMQRMYDTDFVTKVKTDNELLSVNDRRALGILEKSIKKVDGHYQVALPWKSDQISFPNNRIMALRRLNQLKKRFLKDPAFFERYREKIESYLSNGYAQQVSLDAGISMKAWYLPHHAVQEKFRVVFDCGASYKGTSLNSQLLQGPDQTSSLTGVLLRFRRGEVAVTADVKAMFHQVRVEPDDAESLRFLWWPKSDF